MTTIVYPAGTRVTVPHMPQLGTGAVQRVYAHRLLVTFPNAPYGPYADEFHPGELRLAAAKT